MEKRFTSWDILSAETSTVHPHLIMEIRLSDISPVLNIPDLLESLESPGSPSVSPLLLTAGGVRDGGVGGGGGAKCQQNGMHEQRTITV